MLLPCYGNTRVCTYIYIYVQGNKPRALLDICWGGGSVDGLQRYARVGSILFRRRRMNIYAQLFVSLSLSLFHQLAYWFLGDAIVDKYQKTSEPKGKTNEPRRLLVLVSAHHCRGHLFDSVFPRNVDEAKVDKCCRSSDESPQHTIVIFVFLPSIKKGCWPPIPAWRYNRVRKPVCVQGYFKIYSAMKNR